MRTLRIVERLLGHLDPDEIRLGGIDLVHGAEIELLQSGQHVGCGGQHAFDLMGGQSRDQQARRVAQIDEDEAVEIGALAPIVAARLQDRLLADLMLHQIEGPGAVGADAELAALLRIEDGEGIVEEMLRDRELGLLAVEPHGVVIDLLDGIGIPDLGDGLAVLLHAVEHIAGHQPDDRGADGFVEDMLEVPDHILGGEGAAVVPFDALADMERPGLQILAGIPAFQQIGPGDVVDPGPGQIFRHLAEDVRRLQPVDGMGRGDLLDPMGDMDGAALRHVGERRGDGRLAIELADEAIGGARREAEQGRAAQELAAIDLSLRELLLQDGNIGMLFPRHEILPVQRAWSLPGAAARLS